MAAMNATLRRALVTALRIALATAHPLSICKENHCGHPLFHPNTHRPIIKGRRRTFLLPTTRRRRLCGESRSSGSRGGRLASLRLGSSGQPAYLKRVLTFSSVP
eukprot:2731068-Pleurochrysis_carterae.AAC.2